MKNGALFKYSKIVSTVGAITSFKAVKADTFEAVFENEVPADAVLTITKNSTEQSGAWSWSEDRKTATFKGTARFSNGEYEITAKKGEASVTAKTTVEDEKVDEIKILCDTILTGSLDKNATSCDNKEGYIYYQVLNQYKEDITPTIDVQWTISSSTVTNVEPSKGKITIASTGDAFRYGTDIMIVGVYASDGAIVQETRKIGMEQCIASVEAKGFVNYKSAKIEEAVPTLPKDFAKKTWSMVYEAKDQNGMVLDAVPYSNKDITFISNNPLLLKSDFLQDKLYTLKDKETGLTKQYASVMVEPGDYADQGGEVTIMAISSKAGIRKEFTFTIGERARLKSLTLTPPTLVTDGDKNVPLTYIAKDVNGNEVTDYETIVRSSNTLSLNASVGTLTVKEGDDGKAVVLWSDTDEVTYEDSRSHDNIARIVSLTTVVVGGDSNNIMMNVKDKRRPVAFKSVDFGLDKNDSMVIGNTSTTDLLSDQVMYVDQYGSDMKGSAAALFFNTAFTSFNDAKYCLRVKTDDGKYLGLEKDTTYDTSAAAKVKFEAKDVVENGIGELEKDQKAGTTTVTYSIATVGTSGVVDKGNTLVATYNTVPQAMVLSNVEASPNNSKYQMVTSNTKNANGIYLSDDCFVASGGVLKAVDNENGEGDLKLEGANVGYTVKGKARRLNNVTLTLPSGCYSINDSSDIVKNGTGLAVTQGAISWSELYNDNDARRARKDAKKTLVLDIFNTTGAAPVKANTVETTFTISDAGSYPVAFSKAFEFAKAPTATVLKPVIPADVMVLDQYGNNVTSSTEITYNITLTEEAENENTHLSGSFDIINNNTSEAHVKGAEIGDKCKVLTNVLIKGSRTIAFTDTKDITIGADTKAWISSADNDNDKKWRKADTFGDGLGLGMNR